MASGGRRIKRSVIIKTSTIRFLNHDDIKRFEKIALISDYLENGSKEIEKYNNEHNADKSLLINGRNFTNFGVFRKYLQTYIENHSAIMANQCTIIGNRRNFIRTSWNTR